MLRTSFVSSIPSTMMSPRWCSSSLLMVRMKVDLPDPDGPNTTTTSVLRTVVEMPLSAWKLPNHLCTSRQMIMSSISVFSSLGDHWLPPECLYETIPMSANASRRPNAARSACSRMTFRR